MDITSYIIGQKTASGGGITPTGTINITENGKTNVTAYEEADVNVQPDLESKSITITENTTTLVEPTTGKDGLSSVSITTNVAGDLSEYFNSTIGAGTSQTDIGWAGVIKKFPSNLTVNGTSLYYGFTYTKSLLPTSIDASNVVNFGYCFNNIKTAVDLDLSNWTFGNSITNFTQLFSNSSFTKLNLSSIGNINSSILDCSNMIYNCASLTQIDLSNFTYSGNGELNCSKMFQYSTRLTEIDMSNFDFTKITDSFNMFGTSSSNGPADNCLIYVKNQTQVDWFTTNFPRLTNVQIKS